MSNRIWVIPRTDGKYDAVAINDNGDGTVTLKILEKGKPEYPFLYNQFDFANSSLVIGGTPPPQGNFVDNVFTQSGSLITSSGTTPVELIAGPEQNVLRILSGLPKYSRLGQWLIVGRTTNFSITTNTTVDVPFDNLISRSSGEATSWWNPGASGFTISATNPPTPVLVLANIKISYSSTASTTIQVRIKGPNATVPFAYNQQTVSGTSLTVVFNLAWLYTPTLANELISISITNTSGLVTFSVLGDSGDLGSWAAVYAL